VTVSLDLPAPAAVAATPAADEPAAPSRTIEESGRQICMLAQEVSSAGDLDTALRLLTELRAELDALERLHVARGLAAGRSFGDLARVLGISRQAAHRRYRALAPRRGRPGETKPGRLEATEQVRQIVRLAWAETCAAGSPAMGSRELLLAILRTDTDAAEALRSEGVTLERARACRAPAPETGDPSGLRRILRCAGRLALARGDGRLSPGHVLAAIIAEADAGAVRTLTALGATPASIRVRLGY
jgi:ATP-dependent Clp protease ATP-binding subunit ClpA